ncbi:MAG: hypothetical protein KBC98_00170 [Candidatus Pacebacteria bacterium]|nr:hypothetical protein [Candidatus Paceibacterota bacterium]
MLRVHSLLQKKRAEKGKQSDEYLLGTNDALDATKKIDLIEYSQKGTRTEIKFVQIKTQDMDMNEIQDATTAHQAYLNSFIDTIQSLLKKSDIEAAHALLTPEGAFRDPAVKKSVKEKFEMMSMALADLPETIQTTKEFLSHVHEQSGKQREPISEEDVSIFLHAFENEQNKKDFEIFLGPDSMPDGGVENLAARADQLEEDVAHVLQRYFSKQGGVDMRSVDFYSVSETPNKVFLEKKLANPLREYEEMSELDKIAA